MPVCFPRMGCSSCVFRVLLGSDPAGMKRRVVITGMGLVSPLGNTKEALWESLAAGRSGVAASENPVVDIAAEAREFTGHIDDFGELPKDLKKQIRKGLKVMCRETQMGVASAQKAVADAQFSEEGHVPERFGCVFGSDYMMTEPAELTAGVVKCGALEHAFDFTRWGTEGLAEMTPLWLLKYLPNMPGSHIAIFNDLRGPSNSLTVREASSNLAVGEAYHTILRGQADRMMAGSTGTRVHPMTSVHAAQTESLAESNGNPSAASRPFDANRTGCVLGEGAGTVILEELESAQARGATIYAEVIGTGSSVVADRNLIAHRDTALANAMRSALRAAELSPEEVGHINAHGLASKTSDVDEARAISEIFGDRASTIPLVAAKSYFGNLGAGSGIIELMASILALREGRLFSVLNYETSDPECPVAAVTNDSTPSGETFVTLSVTPQAQASALVVRAFV